VSSHARRQADHNKMTKNRTLFETLKAPRKVAENINREGNGEGYLFPRLKLKKLANQVSSQALSVWSRTF